MRVIPRLNLNQNPQNCEEGSLMFAKNMRLDSDGSLVSDFGYNNISALSDKQIVGHIVGLDNIIYIFTYTDNNSEIYEYNERTETATKIQCGWKYSGGEIDGTVTTNISGEKILSIAEYIDSKTKLIPIKHINLSFCKDTDDESIYTQAPRVPMCNLTLNNTYAKTIPNGTYVFFIRYKIRTDVYTNWYLCSCPIFGGTSTKINTLQGGLSYINYRTDSAKSFIFDVSFVNESAKSLYKSFQLGFIISHDDSTNARAWKEFDIDTNKIYFDYEQITDIDIDELLATTYEIYNVRNITSFKNKLYISNYIESNINENVDAISKALSINYVHSDPNGSNNVLYRNMKLNGNELLFNDSLGYYDSLASRSTISSILKTYMFDYDVSNLYKGDTVEKDKIASFDIKWDAANNPDLCTVYNIFNDAYDDAIFGYTEERLYNGGKIGITQHYAKGGLWLYDRDTNNKHQWDDLGFTFIYGSAEERDSTEMAETRNGVFLFNKNTKHWGIGGDTDLNYWASRDKGFSNEARAFIQKNIKDEIENKNRLVYCYMQFSSGAKTYSVDFSNYMNKSNYIGKKEDKDYGYENANNSSIYISIKNKIEAEVFKVIQSKVVGIDENGALVFNFDGDIIRVCAATIVFKSVQFTIDTDDIADDDSHFNKRFYVNAKTTEWKSVCNFSINDDYIEVHDTAEKLNQTATLMPLSKYNVYVHYVDDNHIITNGKLVTTLETDGVKSNTDVIDLTFTYNTEPPASKYKGFFFSIINIGRQVIECFNYRRLNNNTHIVNCIEVDCLLYNINTDIKVIKIDSNGNEIIITEDAKYYSSGSSFPTLAFGNCGYIGWTGEGNHSSDRLYVVIDRDASKEKNYDLIKCSPYYPLEQTDTTTIDKGFYGSHFCLVKKPDFDLSSNCYVSGKDVYDAKRGNTLSLSEFKGYIQIQNSITYFIRSNFNLNYLSLTEDINDQIFSVGSASSGLKQVAKVINSATLSFIYELKGMYKNYRNKLFREYDDTTRVDFNNTIRVSTVLSDETFNNSVFKFISSDYYNVPTDRGIIVKLFSIGNNIFVHTKGSLYKFDANQTLVSNDKDIKLKESDPFTNGITQICDSQYGYAGIDDKHSGCVTFDTYIFYDKQSNHLFGYSGQSQLGQIDADIFKIIKYYKPIGCRMIHDDKNTRILINFIITDDKEITISFNYKTKHFISLHDITLRKAFNSRDICYSYNGNFCTLFNEADTINTNTLYGDATKDSYLTDAPDEGTYKDCKHSISVILFPDESQRASLDSIQYIADVNKTNMFANTAKNKTVLDISRNTKINPVKEFFATTDECKSTSVITNVDDSARPNSLLDYKGFKYNLGFWTSNYFRNALNADNIYKYPNQPGVDLVVDDKKETRHPNSDNNSLVYGRYFILTFGFINGTPIKFENVLINNQKY